MTNKIQILCSVDDGLSGDLGLGTLLLKYRIPTIFYIPTGTTELEPHQIKCFSGSGDCSLSKRIGELFTVGSHTITHPADMKLLSDEELLKEISGSKQELEKIVGFPIKHFCYPKGRYNDKVIEFVKKAGYEDARTTDILCTDFPKDPFRTATTIHASLVRVEYGDKTWIEWGTELLDKVIKDGGRFEIWMHSNELERHNQEEFIEDFFWYMDKKMTEINYPRKIC
jgi:peptidoglycan/xylan/chitin deacetylase (PgdA/CDA1 family)